MHRVGRHQLRVREALVDIFVDDVRFVQDQVTFDENRHLAVRVHHRNVFRLVEQVNVADFKIHAFSNRTRRQRWENGQVVPEYNTIMVEFLGVKSPDAVHDGELGSARSDRANILSERPIEKQISYK